jgi:hypothetical protein
LQSRPLCGQLKENKFNKENKNASSFFTFLLPFFDFFNFAVNFLFLYGTISDKISLQGLSPFSLRISHRRAKYTRLPRSLSRNRMMWGHLVAHFD